MSSHRNLLRRIAIAATIGILSSSASAMDDTSSDSGPEINYCAAPMEQFLPGDFYACRALVAMKTHHPEQAMKLLEQAAGWANKNAQRLLGQVYFYGDSTGIKPNKPLGLAWLALAAERKDPAIVGDYEKAREQSTTDDANRAYRLYLPLKAKYGDAVAGKRATAQYEKRMRVLEAASVDSNHEVIYDMGQSGMQMTPLLTGLKQRATEDFEGLEGHVTVGPLTQAQSPPK
jgi:TPR repeat protein